MSGVINNIEYINTEGIMILCRVSLMTYDILILKVLEQYVGCH
jgi:hypothetical protein